MGNIEGRKFVIASLYSGTRACFPFFVCIFGIKVSLMYTPKATRIPIICLLYIIQIIRYSKYWVENIPKITWNLCKAVSFHARKLPKIANFVNNLKHNRFAIKLRSFFTFIRPTNLIDYIDSNYISINNERIIIALFILKTRKFKWK